jgi:CO/xanthine dehydrogenase Mo-binding subunit
MEIHLDKIAEKLGQDPLELRLKQLVEPGMVTVNGLKISTCGLKECIEKVAERSGWKDKFRKLPYGRGVGFAASAYISGAGLPIYWNKMPHSGVQIRLDRGGGITVFCGSTDIGQGSDSILVYAVAEEFGVNPNDVRVITADTDLTPVDLGSYSSRVTVMTGNAAIQACGKSLPMIWSLPTVRCAAGVTPKRRSVLSTAWKKPKRSTAPLARRAATVRPSIRPTIKAPVSAPPPRTLSQPPSSSFFATRKQARSRSIKSGSRMIAAGLSTRCWWKGRRKAAFIWRSAKL